MLLLEWSLNWLPTDSHSVFQRHLLEDATCDVLPTRAGLVFVHAEV